jgi:hypothetical protein
MAGIAFILTLSAFNMCFSRAHLDWNNVLHDPLQDWGFASLQGFHILPLVEYVINVCLSFAD